MEQNTAKPKLQAEVSGHVIFDRDKFISYFKAEQYLEFRLHITPDEIAQWVSIGAKDGGLNAYTINKYDDKAKPFAFDSSKFIKDDDYKTPLLRLYFLTDEIHQFQPDKRYIARLALIERWTKFLDDEEQAISFIAARESILFVCSQISLHGYSNKSSR